MNEEIRELQNIIRSLQDHHHCLDCGDVIPRYFRYCPPCERKRKEVERLHELGL